MAGSSETTTDHEVIRRWAEERNGRPASVPDTGEKGGAGLLRIDFEEKEPDDRLEPISWEQFFEKFEESGLAFLYQDTLKSGKQSRFFKFVQREGTSRDMGGRGKRGTRGQGSAAEGNDGEKGDEKKTTVRRRAAPKDEKAQEEERKRKEEEKAAREEEKRKQAEAKKREAEKAKEEKRKEAERAKEEKRKEAEAKKREAEKAKAAEGGEKKTTARRRSTKAEGEGSQKSGGRSGGGRAGSSNTTTDPDEIRNWVESRQGHPARVRDTGGKNDPGLLRIDFDERNPDERDARLEWIEWDEFFKKFEEAGLAFLYQDRKKSGEESRFFKFVQREGTSRDMGGRGKRGSRGSGSAGEGEG